MGYKDPEMKKAYDKKYAKENHLQILEANRIWRLKNRERLREKNKQWRLRNLEAQRQRDRIRMSKWRKANPEKHKKFTEERRMNIRKQIWEYKEIRGCLRCPEKDPRCLDFHHRDPTTKSYNIASGVSNKVSFETLMKEIEKCDLLCRNCHVKTYKRIYQK